MAEATPGAPTAARGRALTRAEIELERLKLYLIDWAEYEEIYRPALGTGGMVSWAKGYISEGYEGGYLVDQGAPERKITWACGVIDACAEDIRRMPDDGPALYCALRMRYMNEGVSRRAGMDVTVIRSGRLSAISFMEASALADRAEQLLIPLVKRKGLPL